MYNILCEILLKLGGKPPFTFRQLAGGRNNRAFLLDSGGRRFFVKFFLPETVAERRNLEHETDFLRYSNLVTPGRTPRLLLADPGRNFLVTEFVEGEPFRGNVTEREVSEAARWIRDLNSAPSPPALLPAADSCRCNQDHFKGVARRLESLISSEAVSDGKHPSLVLFLEQLKHDFAVLEEESFFLPENPDRMQIVSPSDFGFHNILRLSSGQFLFLDFEYAGWDDPAKLICDFFCQPDDPVPVSFLDVFLEEMSGILPDAALLKKRLRVLLNLHRIKWSCILLNELLPSRARNRVFSGTDGIPVPNLLARARKYYENPLSRRHDSDSGDSGRVQRIAGEESVS